MAQQTPLYQGTQYAPAKIAGATAPVQHPFTQQFQATNQGIAETARNFELAIQDRQEYTLEQKRSAALQEAAHSMNMEFMDRLQRADGTEGSLFDEFGQLNIEAVNELKQKYLSISDAWTTGFTSERGLRAATEAQNKYRAAVVESIDSKILASLKPRALAALDRNIKADLLHGNHDVAISRNEEAVDRNLLTPEEADISNNKIIRDRWLKDIHATEDINTLQQWLNDPNNVDFFYNNPDISDAAQRKLNGLLRYKAQSPHSQNQFGETVVASSASGKKQKSTGTGDFTYTHNGSTRQLPPSAGGIVKNLVKTSSDKFVRPALKKQLVYNPKDPETQKRARALFSKFVHAHAFADGSTDFSEDFYTEADYYADLLGVDSDAVDRIIAQRKKSLSSETPKFNPSSAVETLKGNMKTSLVKARRAAPDYGETFDIHESLVHDALMFAELDYHNWLNAGNSDKNEVEKARAFQHFLETRRQGELAAYPEHAWYHMHHTAYFDRWEEAAMHARAGGYAEKEKAKEFKNELEALQQIRTQNETVYRQVTENLDLIESYFNPEQWAAAARAKVRHALDHQARSVRFETPVGDVNQAVNLPNSRTERIIYVNPDSEKTSAISRLVPTLKDGSSGIGYILVQTDNDILRVAIVESDQVTAPVPSLLLQRSLPNFGQYFNYMTFHNNILSFVYSPEVAARSSNSPTSLPEVHYDPATGYPSLFPNDGLVPADLTGELDQ